MIRSLLTGLLLVALLGAGILALVAAVHPDPVALLAPALVGPLAGAGEALFAALNDLPRGLPVLEYIGVGLVVVAGICLGHLAACTVKRAMIAQHAERRAATGETGRLRVNHVPPFIVTLVGIGLLGYGGKLYGDYRMLMARDFGAPKIVAEATARLEAARAAGEAAGSETEAEAAATGAADGGAAGVPTALPAFSPSEESFAAARAPVSLLAGVTFAGALVFGWSIGQRRMSVAQAMGDGSLADVEAAEQLARQAETGKGLEHYAADVPGLKLAGREEGYNAREKRAEIIRKLEARMPEDAGRRGRRRASA